VLRPIRLSPVECVKKGRGTVYDTVCREKFEMGDGIGDLLEIALGPGLLPIYIL
jgi:hypothetical protein